MDIYLFPVLLPTKKKNGLKRFWNISMLELICYAKVKFQYLKFPKKFTYLINNRIIIMDKNKMAAPTLVHVYVV